MSWVSCGCEVIERRGTGENQCAEAKTYGVRGQCQRCVGGIVTSAIIKLLIYPVIFVLWKSVRSRADVVRFGIFPSLPTAANGRSVQTR